MVCCAVAALLVAQLVVALDGFRERLRLTPVRRSGSQATNPAVAWRFEEAGSDSARAAFEVRTSLGRRLVLGLSAASLVFGLTLALSSASPDAAVEAWPADAWCSSVLSATRSASPSQR